VLLGFMEYGLLAPPGQSTVCWSFWTARLKPSLNPLSWAISSFLFFSSWLSPLSLPSSH
jgi:hypothetical protein